MKRTHWIALPLALFAAALLGGCSGGSDSTASASEEKMYKNPIKGTPPTAEQMKASGPTHIGPASGAIPVGGGSTGGATPPPEAMKQPGTGG